MSPDDGRSKPSLHPRRAHPARSQCPESREGDVTTAGPFAIVFGKLLAYVLLQAVVLPFLFDHPSLSLWPAATWFVCRYSHVRAALRARRERIGVVIAAIFRKPIAVQLAFAAVGLPIFFLAGFAWPHESILACDQGYGSPVTEQRGN